MIGTPLGKYSRRIRLAFSLLPRCQGECGRAKYTGSPAAVILAWPAISDPQSQVNDFAICGGRVPAAAMIASPTVSASRPISGTRTTNREGALDQGRHGAFACLADDQVAFPVPGDLSALDLGGAFVEVARLTDPRRRSRPRPATSGHAGRYAD